MKNLIPFGHRFPTALLAVVLAASLVQAQGTNPNGSPYPYWSSAPQSYSGSMVTIPVPGMSPSIISNASQSPPSPTSVGVGIGGGYIPPSLTLRDTGMSLPRRDSADAERKAHILLRVPADAEIWVNGVKTKQTGESRYFFSPPLTPGKTFSYQIRVQWKKDGKPTEQSQRILVRAGETIRRDLTSPEKTEPRP